MRTSFKALAVMALLIAAGCDSTTLPGALVAGTNDNASTSLQLLVTSSTSLTAATTPVLISASITKNGTAVTDGTDVAFNTNLGAFGGSSSGTILLPTTNGLVGASFTSRTAGVATVTVTAGGIAQSVIVVFTQPPGTQRQLPR